jgi:hypothetical protein
MLEELFEFIHLGVGSDHLGQKAWGDQWRYDMTSRRDYVSGLLPALQSREQVSCYVITASKKTKAFVEHDANHGAHLGKQNIG